MKVVECRNSGEIYVAIERAKKGRCCSYRLDIVVKVDEKIYCITRTIFERIWAAFVSIFGIDMIKRKFNNQPIQYITSPTQIKNDDLEVIDEETIEKIVLASSTRGSYELEFIKQFEEKILEYIENENFQRLYLKPGQALSEDFRYLSCLSIGVHVPLVREWLQQVPEAYRSCVFYSALELLLLKNKIGWFLLDDRGDEFKVGRLNTDAHNPGDRAVTKEKLVTAFKKVVDIATLHHNPCAIDTDVLRYVLDKVNKSFFPSTPQLSDNATRLFSRNPGEKMSQDERQKYEAVLNFLAEKKVIYSWKPNSDASFYSHYYTFER